MLLQRIREKVNLFLYDSKKRALQTFRVFNILVTFIAIITILYYYGYPQDENSKETCLGIIKGSFIFYIFYFLLRFLYDFEPRKFLKQNWFEAIMMLFLVIEGISYNLFGALLFETLFKKIGIIYFTDFTTLFIQFYFFIVLIIEISRAQSITKPLFKLHPASLFMFSFFIIISFGTMLLMMPEMTVSGTMNFVDALFTATSATCVTGLTVVDTATFFTVKGQVVILLLIKLGGLNIVAFISFIIIMSKMGVGVKYHSFMDDYARKGTIESATKMLRKILWWSIVFEATGTLAMYMFLESDNPLFDNNGEKIFASFFHAVSAFNNAGFSIFTDGMYNEYIRYNYFVHVVIIVLIFFGSLGFAALFDIFSFKNLRERMRMPWKTISFNSKIALYISIILVIAGTILFFILEYDNTLSEKNLGEALVTALFQSVTTRTAGFNTVDVSSLSIPVLIMFLFLMFIGASSNSTGGGIKTSTFAVLFSATLATIKDRKNVELFKRTISQETILKAFTILLFFISWNLIAIFLLTITETDIMQSANRSVMHIIFEQVSAFATVGLSMGITSELSEAGKIIIILSMYIGKVGALAVAYIVGTRAISKNYKYPTADMMIG
jgi:potassium uptake TrkH family protein